MQAFPQLSQLTREWMLAPRWLWGSLPPALSSPHHSARPATARDAPCRRDHGHAPQCDQELPVVQRGAIGPQVAEEGVGVTHNLGPILTNDECE